MSESTRESKPAYWRSLAERDGSEEFARHLEAEFPSEFPSAELLDASGLTRRSFLQVMGASMALAGLASCSWPEEEIVPFGKRPENYQPGRLRHYATTFGRGTSVRPVLVASYDGRPIKVEGNPDHPLSRGATDLFGQAEVLGLYDPDREQAVRRRHAGTSIRSSWAEFDAFAREHFGARADGTGLAVLSPPSRSIAVARLRAELAAKLPGVRFHEYDSAGSAAEAEGLARTFGADTEFELDLSRAHVIADFDADLLASHPTAVRNARGFAQGRDPQFTMNRLYVFEPSWSVTGSAADHRVPTHVAEVEKALLLLAARLVADHHLPHPDHLAGLPRDAESLVAQLGHSEHGEKLVATIDALAKDLAHHTSASLVAVGERHGAAVHALCARINAALGSLGSTIVVRRRPELLGGVEVGDLAELCRRMHAGEIDTLVILGANPVYDAPRDLDFAEALAKVPTSIHLGEMRDETARACTWFLPRAHALESWGDVVALDGTLCVVQPLIAPLYEGRTDGELLSRILGDDRSAYELAREAFHVARGGRGPAPELDPGFEDAWRKYLHDGFVTAFGSSSSAVPEADAPLWAELKAVADAPLVADGSFELQIALDRRMLDGRYANNAWLQELPDPVTKLTWGNAALVSVAAAEELGIAHGDVVRVSLGGQNVELPAMLLPGQAPRTVTVHLGYGRRFAGRVGDGVGVDVGALRSSRSAWGGPGAEVARTGRREELACTQDHFAIDTRGRNEREMRAGVLVREGTIGEYHEHPEFAQHIGPHHPPLESLWKEFEFDGHRWAMSIDLSKCIGCNACVVACVAENNIPVVGKEQVINGREMHWLRIDRYFQGDPADPKIASQPMACAHCELAPCEQVCPVGATMHSEEGLNVMAYNRCVGTRYCSNNCPTKVRRFNFFEYNGDLSPVEQLGKNPEVTVRSRGVMEKCTYCVQRIEHARINAKNERRELRDGDIVPACGQTCPTQAIVFGDLALEGSEVARQHEHDLSYAVLAELNIKPRTRYLARLRNPHPDLADANHHGHTEPSHGGDDHGAAAHG